ncbi:type II toxin-antitoxin system VapC family toxin [uncultured Cocleimonas sp.]|uniref:type II toxin-antitoxin system VapC family toxin n=1 Tax=uncultured Cocleimonas sp. TaxID=1051587 RepID=UPI0026118B6E|nr:type II toxin-antitoxin system VapC family toxin [uncultured Cocleimonas sp.]
MRIIIDTYIFLWAISDPSKLDDKQRLEIETAANIIYVSSVSITELMIKASIGKLVVNYDPIAIAKESGFELLDFSAEDALALKELPFHHKDPFDRMLVSQALNRKYALMTDDGKMSQYDCRLI